MKGLLVFCLAVLAVTASTLPRPFQGQQNYVFRFDTQISSSLIGSSPADLQQAAATRLRAEVRLSFTNDRHANMALNHIRMGELNADLPKSQRVQPLEHFERKEIPVEVKQTLEYPLSVSIVDGVVERINFHESDSVWSKNIKRAVLNMIQLNLKRNDVQGLKMQSSMPSNEGEQDIPVFSVPEVTLEGQCEVVYTLQKSNRYGDEDENTQFNVTKTIDFGKCLKTADVSYGYQQANPAEQLRCLKCLRQQSSAQGDLQEREQARFGHCQQECQPNKINEDKDVERSTFARYELVGKQEKYAIKRSSMISQYVVKAQNPASQNTLIQVVALSELTFKEQDSQQKVQSFKQSSTDETLMFSSEYDVKEKRFYMNGDEEFQHQSSPFAKVQKKQQKASHAMRQILRQWADKKQGYELDAALNFNRLVQVLRESTVSEIKEIEQLVQQQDETESQNPQELTKTIFLDALSSAATRNTLQVLAEKIMKSEIKAWKAAQLIKSFVSNQHSPSEAQVAILERIAKHEVAHRSGPLKQTAWLAYGEAVGAICQDKPAQSAQQSFRVEALCTRGKKDQYKKTLLQEFKQAETIYEKILVLKSIGNAALDNMSEELGRIVKDKQQPTLVRMEAIDALRRLRTSQPEKIQQILMPIFQNQRQEPEIRMAAFSMILFTQPEKSLLDQIAFSVIHDRSQNVKTFVLTALESLSKSPNAAEQQVATHMKAALKMIQLQPEELRSSRKYRVPIYISEQEDTEEQNIFLALTSIVSPSNMLPIHLATSIQSALNGQATNKNFELLLSQKNLEQWYEKIAEYAEQYGQSSDEDKDDMARRSAKDLRQIYSSLSTKNRRHGSYYLSSSEESDEQQPGKQSKTAGDNQPFGMIVIRSNDVDKYIVPVSEHQLPEVVRKMIKGEKPSLMSQLDELSQKLTTGQQQFRQHIGLTTGDKKTRIPTTSGLPLSLERKISAVGSVEGELKIRLESENLESSRGLTAELKLRASGIATHLHRAKVWSPVVISGVETIRTIEMNGPLDIKLRADREKVEIKMNLPTEHRIRLAAIHTLPFSFVRQYNMQTRTESEPRVKTIHNWALEHASREYSIEEGQALQVQGHYHHLTMPKEMLQALYTTANDVHWYFAPNSRTPKSVLLRLSGHAFQQHKDHTRPELDSFYSSNKGFKQIYEEDFEGMNLEQNDEQRQSSLSAYSKQYSPKDSYRHQLKIEAEAHCGSTTHKVSAEIKGACDSGLKHCKLFLEAERSPLMWSMKTKIQTVAPEQITQNDEDMTKKQSRMLVDIQSEWGAERRNNQMNIRVQAEPTKTQYWGQPQQQKWSRFLNKIDLVADYQLQPAASHVVQRFYELAKAKAFWSVSVQDRHQSGNENVVRATVVIDPITKKHMNVSIATPTERVRAQSIELPVRVAPFTLSKRSSKFNSFGSLIQSVTSFSGAQCKADDRRVKTFDGVSYRAPLSSCWSVLAKDCSREEPRFVVMMKKTEESKKVKIITPRSTIELSSKQGQRPIVKINGEQETNEEELQQQGIELSYDQVYIRKSGINVQFDGEEVQVKVGGQYKNLQCGLCGHYNNEEEDVFRLGNGQRSNSLKEFHKSYTLKNEECDNSQLNKHYEQDSTEFEIQRQSGSQRRQQQSAWFDDSEEESRRFDNQYDSDEEQMSQQERRQNRQNPVKRTKVIEYSHKICLSSEPVKTCPRGTVQSGDVETKTIHFSCVDRNSADARRFLRMVRQGKVVPSSELQKGTFTEQIEVPQQCRRQSTY